MIEQEFLMTRWWARSTILFVAALVIWVGYSRRILISAWIWHLQHGTSLVVGNYVVPVPKNWYVQDWGSENQLLVRLDTDERTRLSRLKAHAGVSLAEEPTLTNDQTISSRMSLAMDSLKREGVNPVMQRTFDIGNGRIVCAGGYKPKSPGIYDLDPVAWSCSTHGLELRVVATEPDMEQVWNIVSGIRKRS